MARGDHIRVRRLRGLYWHHGIDVGDGTVVHYSGEPLHPRKASISQVSLDDFLDGGVMEVVEYVHDLRPAEEVVAYALSRLGERRYGVWWNNCEHFATHCKTGRREIRQVRRAAALAGAGMAVPGSLAVGVLRRQLRRKRRQG